MRLQKQKTREVKGKEYFRWSIVVPPSRIKELGWKEGQELRHRLKKGRLVIEKD
jgi:hypothetical protein